MSNIKTFTEFTASKKLNESIIENRNSQINFIVSNAEKAGYPDLTNKEFVTSLTDLALTNFCKMIGVIITYNDDRR